MTFPSDAARGPVDGAQGVLEMLRATVWTVGLFGAGAAITQVFPGTWTEPLVLFGLGLALLFASARTARSTAGAAPAAQAEPKGRAATPAGRVAPVPAPVPAAVPAAVPAGAPIQVEHTA